MARGKRQAFRITGEVPDLKGIPEDIQRAAMPGIVEAAAAGVREEAPIDRGLGSPKSIVSRVKGRVELEGERGIVASKAPHSHLQEYGIRPHSLARGAGRSKKRPKNTPLKIFGGENIIRRGAWHPGIKANPFMERGLASAEGDIADVLAEEGQRAVERHIKTGSDLVGVISGLT